MEPQQLPDGSISWLSALGPQGLCYSPSDGLSVQAEDSHASAARKSRFQQRDRQTAEGLRAALVNLRVSSLPVRQHHGHGTDVPAMHATIASLHMRSLLCWLAGTDASWYDSCKEEKHPRHAVLAYRMSCIGCERACQCIAGCPPCHCRQPRHLAAELLCAFS